MDLDGDISYSKLEEVDYRDSTHTVPDAVLPSRHKPRKRAYIKRAITSSAYVGTNGLLLIVNVWILLVSLNKIISLRRYCPEIPYSGPLLSSALTELLSLKELLQRPQKVCSGMSTFPWTWCPLIPMRERERPRWTRHGRN